MRRGSLPGSAVLALLVLALVMLVLAPGLAQAKPSSGVRGTVLDATCETGCVPPCPPPPSCRAGAAPCPQGAGASIACPLQRTRLACTQAGCPPPPVETPELPPYEGSAATVLVRRAGTSTLLGRVPVTGGRFIMHLAPGRYVLRAHVAEPCWSGTRQVVEIEAGPGSRRC